ncbi:hypothetical protein J0895_15725 [Phormidium pseudopriestleyi FRX01]|uniref:Uncharacterized protein n=1 Tax=Phormidium pseudopriestleyi FRX01 TaxID=1759528 RepID=A0ABS3FTY4_9CYAN|nr:hypothetical protein [Phormidium pseudopriestleyi]MBO0350518.1 hypothetical protein [Phormidium pseudopriestleyi FRX01]
MAVPLAQYFKLGKIDGSEISGVRPSSTLIYTNLGLTQLHSRTQTQERSPP